MRIRTYAAKNTATHAAFMARSHHGVHQAPVRASIQSLTPKNPKASGKTQFQQRQSALDFVNRTTKNTAIDHHRKASAWLKSAANSWESPSIKAGWPKVLFDSKSKGNLRLQCPDAGLFPLCGGDSVTKLDDLLPNGVSAGFRMISA